MWLGEQMAQQKEQEPEACGGVVSIGGGTPCVVTDGEARDFAVFSPGGYAWLPLAEDRVAVLSRERAVLGAAQQAAPMEAGEVRIFSQGASVYLANDGSIRLQGDVYINGERWVPHGGGTD